MFLVWKVMWNWQQHLFAKQKSKQPMLVEVHDFGDGDDDNDDPPLAKICKFQVPTSINVIIRKWTPLHSVIQYCICNIFPFLSFHVFCWT
jgi:hypothetical protein